MKLIERYSMREVASVCALTAKSLPDVLVAFDGFCKSLKLPRVSETDGGRITKQRATQQRENAMNDQPVALVTGANQGIGLQVAKDLAAHGFTVLIGSRDLARGEEAASAVEGTAVAIQLDVTDAALMASGIPVVTLVTDLPAPARHGSFRDALHKDAPHLGIVTTSEGFGVDRTTERLVKAALVADTEIRAAYSIGGGNRAILKAFAEDRRRIDVFAAHDLDADNRSLLTQGLLTFVIHHDLRQDARSACQMVMAHHRMLPRDFQMAPSRVAIATPYDVF